MKKWTNEEKRRFANAVAGMCKGVVSINEAVRIATSKGSTRGIVSPAEWAQLPFLAAPWGVDVSPYIGAPTGRGVWRHGEAV